VLLTNGGGKHETERVRDISKQLGIQLDTSMFIQSHTPFADLDEYKDKPVLVIGGDGDNCRRVAEASVWLSKFVPIELLANDLSDTASSR
jgi:ribonucleotide monophosphatase NagD (HAD superfamily)